VSFNKAEVSEVAWLTLEELGTRLAAAPGDFTEWLRAELALLGWLAPTAAGTGQVPEADLE
jgi:isopentenyldiphosphate isomerase